MSTAPSEGSDLGTAVVAGGAGGLGSASAVALAADGYSVLVADIDETRVENVVETIRQNGGAAEGFVADLTDEDAVERMFDTATSRLGVLRCLVNTTFRPMNDMPERMSLDQWNENLQVNVTSYFLSCRGAGRRMIATGGGGTIVNFGSIAGVTAVGRGSFVYSVCKGAINQLTKELAVEWAKHGIRVNAILPCQIETPGLLAALGTTTLQGLLPRILAGIPMNRLGRPDDVTGAVSFLASPHSAFITGVLLPVDGGNLALNAGGTHTYEAKE